MKSKEGFKELAHTADVALQVWAPDLTELFIQAARGMIFLMRPSLGADHFYDINLDIKESDIENLLVSFLNELLWEIQVKKMALDEIKIALQGTHLTGSIKIMPIDYYEREIKAVTYNNLKIKSTKQGFKATIVFDV